MKVLVSDALSPAGVEVLSTAPGIDVDVNTGLSSDELESIIGDYDGLVVRSSTQVTEDVISAAGKLKVIGRAGVGVDNIDIDAATRRGIVVMNTPGGNSMAAAEHTIALMFAVCRNIPEAAVSTKNKKWEKKRFTGMEVFRKTIGVIGLGSIGSIVAARAAGLKMNVIAYDPFISPDAAEKRGVKLVSLDELYAEADIITIHVPKTKATANLIDADSISKMKDGVVLINCARGGIVDEAALAEACSDGKVRMAGVDVYSTEPPPPDNPLLNADNVVCTPHLGASTREAQENVAIAVARQIVAYLSNGTIENAMNVPSVDAKVLEALGPYIDLGRKMGGFFAQTCSFPLKELVVEYQGEINKHDIAPVTSALLAGLLSSHMGDKNVNVVNAPCIAKERGVKVRETKSSEEADFASLIILKAENADHPPHTVAGTIFGKSEPRLVKINDYLVESVPEGNILLIDNIDKPGVVGNLGTLMGTKGINIGNMHVGRVQEGGRALCICHLDNVPPSDALAELERLPHVNSVKLIQL